MTLSSTFSRPLGSPRKITYLTAGAAGMICGSCLHDNTLARALTDLGHDVQLVPLYTPIRTDEDDVSEHRIFYGGINMYLQQRVPLFRWLPKWVDRWLDQPWLVNWASGRSIQIDPVQVADLALSILRGTEGFQRKEIDRLAEWLTEDQKPDVIVFSNILTAGCVPEIKRRLNVPVVVTLQGDDVFLREMPQPQQAAAIEQIQRLGNSIDGYLTHSRYYADAMAEYLRLERDKMQVVPLGIDTRDFLQSAADTGAVASFPPTIGYLARLAPEKGLHLLADAFIRLKAMPGTQHARLRIAGWLGGKQQAYADGIFATLRRAGVSQDVEYLGEVDRKAKLEFLQSLDVLSVPTTYKEPKGLFVLEALAAGVPVVAPDHGAFPEMLTQLEGGLLHRPNDAGHLADHLHELLTNPDRRQHLGHIGRENVHRLRNAKAMAAQTSEALHQVIHSNASGATNPAVKVG